MFGEYGDGQRIADPYCTFKARFMTDTTDGRGNSGFERTYEQIVRYSDGLLASMGFPSAKA